MLKPVFAACALLCALPVTAEARRAPNPAYASCIPTGDVMRPCAYQPNFLAGVRSINVTMRRDRAASEARPSRRSVRAAHRAVSRYGAPEPSLTWTATTLVDRAQSYMGGIVAPLATKVSEIRSACGSKVISGVRHTKVAGTRRMSLHASGKAVDLQGNPSCMYSMLHGWAGGYSVDYARVRHLHLSYDPDGGREMGVHFVHGGGHRRHRYAHRHHHRYASAR
jgi:hypothetical protein